MESLAAGTIINQRYRIEQVLGQGGMGHVYLATHLHLQRPVAIKELTIRLDDKAMQESAQRQFHNEARILHELSHPQLPRVHDYFEYGGSWFLVMDFIRGRTLSQIVETEEPLEERQIQAWAATLCDVLEYLHQHKPQVIFRDLKPSNIMLNENGEIRLVDFGISKVLVDETTGSVTQTFAKNSGSPGYAAPEQYSHSTDPRSDIYSLGATLYTLVGGQTPPASVILAAGVVDCPPLEEIRPGLSPELYQAIARMMQLQKSERPQSIAEVRALLAKRSEPAPPPPLDVSTSYSVPTERLPGPEPEPLPVSPAPLAAPAPRRSGWLIGAVGTAAVASLVAFFSSRPPSAELDLTSQPAGAMVYLNGAPRGTTPLHLGQLGPLAYQVRLEASGYAPAEQTVTLDKGERRVLDIPLARLRCQAVVKATTGEVHLDVDGQPFGDVGAQPVSIDLQAGTHQLVFRRGRRQAVRKVTLDGQHPTQEVVLDGFH